MLHSGTDRHPPRDAGIVRALRDLITEPLRPQDERSTQRIQPNLLAGYPGDGARRAKDHGDQGSMAWTPLKIGETAFHPVEPFLASIRNSRVNSSVAHDPAGTQEQEIYQIGKLD